MSKRLDPKIPQEPLLHFLVALADDELILGHRDSEWTGHAPILEEDIAFSNIAQDELGHSLALFELAGEISGTSPDTMAFERSWNDFRCCRFVEYPKGDFAYSVVRQYLFDAAEQVRMKSLEHSTVEQLRDISGKILAEEAYHLMHTQGLLERLADATDESRRRMREAVTAAFPQALGMFELMEREGELVRSGVIVPSQTLRDEWLAEVVPLFRKAALSIPVTDGPGGFAIQCSPEDGGRGRKHTAFLRQLVQDLQLVYQTVPGAKW